MGDPYLYPDVPIATEEHVDPGSQFSHPVSVDESNRLVPYFTREARRLRLEQWGEAALPTYKDILETCLYMGFRVNIFATAPRSQDLEDGEFYISTYNWLFRQGTDRGARAQGAPTDHTFKFNREAASDNQATRKARCNRKGCGCTNGSAFEVFGVRLGNRFLYHFRRSAIAHTHRGGAQHASVTPHCAPASST